MRNPQPVQKKLGDILRKAREDAGLSQRDLARVTGMPIGQISMIETGVRLNPTFLTVLKLAKGLRISLDLVASEYTSGKFDTGKRSSFEPSEREYLAMLREIQTAKGEAERAVARLDALLEKPSAASPMKKQKKGKRPSTT